MTVWEWKNSRSTNDLTRLRVVISIGSLHKDLTGKKYNAFCEAWRLPDQNSRYVVLSLKDHTFAAAVKLMKSNAASAVLAFANMVGHLIDGLREVSG